MRTISACIAHLWRQGVLLEASLLKPQMIVPGADWTGPKPDAQHIAERTLRVMRRAVPPAIPGIMFLSGGQTEVEATENLHAINVAAGCPGSRAPWALSFSFGRALQTSVLQLWTAGNDAGLRGSDRGSTETNRTDGNAASTGNEEACKAMATALARVNGLATTASYQGRHPSVLSPTASLQESFRGWRA
jgi:fructose-bisphosphate aldolase, class I